MNFSSAPDNNAPVIDSNTGGAGILSRDVFDEVSGEEGVPTQPDAGSNVSSVLTEEERQLLAMRNFSWDSIAGRYIVSSQDVFDKCDQQNFTRPKPVQPGAESLVLSEEILVDIDRNRDRDRNDEQSPSIQDDQEEEPQDDSGQQDGDATGGEESGNEGNSGNGGSRNDTSDKLGIEASVSLG
jgi:hypothetical protein